jgi:cell division protease FtsH
LNRTTRIIAILAVLSIIAYGLYSYKNKGTLSFWDGPKQLTYSSFQSLLKDTPEKVSTGTFRNNTFYGKYLKKEEGYEDFTVNLPTDGQSRESLRNLLDTKGIKYEYAVPAINEGVLSVIGSMVTLAVLVTVLWLIFMRQVQSSGNQAMNFGRARIKRINENVPKVTFDDVAGVDEAKQDLQEIVEFLRNSRRYQALGAKIPKGVLLLGPPGSGKTLLARAIAGEAGVPFFHISGSDFVEMFVGVGASRVRDLFEQAKQNRPSLIFIDEIDAVGRQRGAGWGGGHDEREQTLNQLLVEMDGFDPNAGVILIAATNRPDVLDPALLRPGRFDRRVVVDAPDQKGRFQILKVHTKGKPIADDVDIESLSRSTPGFSGADLANLINEAALLAARKDKNKIEQPDFEEAVDRQRMGPARRSRIMTEAIKKRVAYHEAGHAIIGELLANCSPVHKVTILPRGMALGLTISYPLEDVYTQSKEEMEDDIVMSLGGRVAEMLVYNQLDTGAASDLNRVTSVARAMVCEYGMSEKLGSLRFGKRHGSQFLGRESMSEERDYSEEVAQLIDQEVRAIVDRNYKRAEEILETNRIVLERVTDALMERETLDRNDFLALMQDAVVPINGGRIPEKPSDPPSSTPPPAPATVTPDPISGIPSTPSGKLKPGMA